MLTGQLAGSVDVCRTTCASGCSNGETCNAASIKDSSGVNDDNTCQCVPNGDTCSGSDACTPFGLICHPDFNVCVPTEPVGTQCPTGLTYSAICSVCRIPA